MNKPKTDTRAEVAKEAQLPEWKLRQAAALESSSEAGGIASAVLEVPRAIACVRATGTPGDQPVTVDFVVVGNVK